MREQLVAWAGDCMVRGTIDLDDGRLSDQLNEREVVTFYDATLRSLEDGHELSVPEIEVDRLEIHIVEVNGRRGDPARRLRTIEERVTLELGPYWVTGNLHRLPSTQALAALTKHTRFVPVTDAIVVMLDSPDGEPMREEVILVNLDRVGKSRSESLVPVLGGDDWPSGAEPAAPDGQG